MVHKIEEDSSGLHRLPAWQGRDIVSGVRSYQIPRFGIVEFVRVAPDGELANVRFVRPLSAAADPI
tara:strand:- start:460 stop:657 length:198 start_codon:yes stop_codon:yes gene_type:complete